MKIFRLLLMMGVLGVATIARGADTVKFIGEYPVPEKRLSVRPLDGGRHIFATVTWDNQPAGSTVRFRLFDVIDRTYSEFSVSIAAAMAAHPKELTGHVVPELMYDDGTKALVLFSMFFNGVKTIYACRYDVPSGKSGELVLLGRTGAFRGWSDFGFDQDGRHFYFGFFNDEPLKTGSPVSVEIARLRLDEMKIDWNTTVTLPDRQRRLPINHWWISSDGKMVAMVEHNDSEGNKKSPATPPQQAYVIDVEKKTVDTYPAPLRVYAGAFTRDSRYLFLSSNETGDLVRINTETKTVDRRAKGIIDTQHLLLSPGGHTLYIHADTALISRKYVEARSVDTLKLVVTIPIRQLFPGNDGVRPEITATRDGRFWAASTADKRGFADERGIRLYEISDEALGR